MRKPLMVVVTTSFPIAADGSEAAGSFVADFVEALAVHARVRVVAPGLNDGHEKWRDGVEIIRYAAPPQPLSTLKPWRLSDLKWITKVLRGGRNATQVAAEGAEHIFALWGLPCGEWARKTAVNNGIDYSVWVLGSDVWSLGRIPGLRGALARVIRHAQHAYADGFQLANDACRIAGVPVGFLPSSRRIGVNFVPPARDTPPYRLLFLGRWHSNKGVDLLLDALALLGDEDWKRIDKVEIHGGGPMEALVHQKSKGLISAGRPVGIGKFLTKAEAEDAIARSDWVLIPSRIESIPVVFSDAMKMGRPVIAMPVGDLPRLVGAGCGLLSSSVSKWGLLDAIRKAIWAESSCDMGAIEGMSEQFSCAAIAKRVVKECLVNGGHG